MTNPGEQLMRTPLYEAAVDAGGRMVPFGGWEMAVQYEGIKVEHRAVREEVGVFDISHMGQIALAGPGSAGFLDHLLPANVGGLEVGQMLYAPMCNEGGGCVDDVVAYRLADASYLLVVNAGRVDIDWAWIQDQAEGWADITLENLSADRGMVAVQGPRAAEVVAGVADGADTLGYYHCREMDVEGIAAWVSRNGYTGEDGFEIMCASDRVAELWDRLLVAGVRPCGLGARDTLRMEMGFCLYGHELDEDTTPLEAGLGWTLALGKEGDFIGAASLRRMKQEGGYRRLRGLLMSERGIPRANYPIVDREGVPIGLVTSGTQSPVLDRGIGLGYLQQGAQKVGKRVFIEMRGKKIEAEVVQTPFVRTGVKKDV